MTTRACSDRRRRRPVADPLSARADEVFAVLRKAVLSEARRRVREAAVPPPTTTQPLELIPKPAPAKARRRPRVFVTVDPTSLALAVGQDPAHFRANPWPAWRPRHRRHRR